MKSVVVCSDPIVEEQAKQLLTAGAVETVLAGALVAAAREPSVLFGPLQIVTGGTGAGLLAYDGRVRQPGKGAQRPRGFKEGEEIPAAAYVAAPAFAAAVFAALSQTGNDRTTAVFAPAIAQAGTLSPARKDLLNRIARKGAQALAHDDVAGEIVAAVGKMAGGLLTQEDLAIGPPAVERLELEERGERSIAVAPWSRGISTVVPGTRVEIIVAADARGRIAAACWEVAEDGLVLGAFDLKIPKHASPVLRGKTRTKPGDVIPAPAPIAILQGKQGWEAVVGASTATSDALVEAAAHSELNEVLKSIGASATAIARTDDRLRVMKGG